MTRRATWLVIVVLCFVALAAVGVLSAGADHGGNGRLDGPFKVDGRVESASGVFKDQEGDRVRRTYFFVPLCPSNDCDTKIDRETKGGSYVRSLLKRRAESGRYRGHERVSGRCDNGGRFDVDTLIKVHVRDSKDGFARRIGGSTETEQSGCASGKQTGTFEGNLALVNPGG